jgi:hypothetical protein
MVNWASVLSPDWIRHCDIKQKGEAPYFTEHCYIVLWAPNIYLQNLMWTASWSNLLEKRDCFMFWVVGFESWKCNFVLLLCDLYKASQLLVMCTISIILKNSTGANKQFTIMRNLGHCACSMMRSTTGSNNTVTKHLFSTSRWPNCRG